MEFYLNQKSLPMIRKCGSCKYFHKEFYSCSLIMITNAYDHTKKIFLTTGENLYCDNHRFKNEDTLKQEAIVVEYNSIDEAMKVINAEKAIRAIKSTRLTSNDYTEE